MLDRVHMHAYYNTYNSEDAARLREFYHAEVILASAEGETRGADAIITAYQAVLADFRDQMTPANISIGGDTAVVDIVDVFTARKTLWV